MIVLISNFGEIKARSVLTIVRVVVSMTLKIENTN